MPLARCSAHPVETALARCQRCSALLCGDCFRLYAGGKPCCDACAVELSSGPASRWPFAIAFAAIALAISFAGYRLEGSVEIWGISAVVAVVVAVVLGFTGPSSSATASVELSEREPDLEPADQLLVRAAQPYRVRVARVARRIVPLSGRATALVMTAALVLSAVVLPLGLKLPHWIEAELVVGVWWLAVASLLTGLLYTGRRLAEDHRLALGVRGSHDGGDKAAKGAKSPLGDLAGCGSAAGCGEVIAVVAVLAVAAAAAWLVVEIVLPVAVFAVYFFLVKAVGRVARDQHDCEGRLGRAMLWGAAWASVYAVPIALLILTIQAVVQLRAH
ncbi:MAG: B-box zinc finger protein [Myxococcales bacterium]|nr:B-box zinc finger protein [Myxococcales bacterium]